MRPACVTDRPTLEALLARGQDEEDAKSALPRLYRPAEAADRAALETLLERDASIGVVDRYSDMLRELFAVEHPGLKGDPAGFESAFDAWASRQGDVQASPARRGVWAYYPWRRRLVHVPDEDEFFRLRTARNQLLVTGGEQRILRDARVGIIGLSVGQAPALTLAISGMARELRLADPDSIDATNLNRIHATVSDVGLLKTVVLGRRITELDPFAKPRLKASRITSDDVESFLLDGGRLQVVIDAFDDLRMKIVLRQVARKHRIAVLMATDLADGSVLEVERYDLDPNAAMFGGRVDEGVLDAMPPTADAKDWVQLVLQMIGISTLPERMLASLRALGTELAGFPQLGIASFLGGSLVAYAVKRIALGDTTLPSRVAISYESLFQQ